jgi:hypothetical protein
MCIRRELFKVLKLPFRGVALSNDRVELDGVEIGIIV